MNITVRPLAASDLDAADRIFRLAFGTFLKLPDPMAFGADGQMIRTRWHAPGVSMIGAYDGDVLVGSNVLTEWGTFGFFGPLTVHPDYWDRGVASRLLERTIPAFDAAGVRQIGLFTFPNSDKHVALYGKFGFAPQGLTPLMKKTLGGNGTDAAADSCRRLSELGDAERERSLVDCRTLTNEIFGGLDVSGEIRSVMHQQLGETVLLYGSGGLEGLAVCHIGGGSEARTGSAYVKFAAVRNADQAAFDRLVAGCEAVAARSHATQIVAGVNAARELAVDVLRARGFQTLMDGLAMQRPDAPGYNRRDVLVIDDWR